MIRSGVLTALTMAVVALAIAAAGVPAARAADCDRVSVDLTPITDLAPNRYQGFLGGLYLDGTNTPPPQHATIAMIRSSDIQPRRPDGSVAPDGKIVLLSLGMTFTTLEYQAFMQLAAGDPQVSPDVLMVDGAQEGRFATDAALPNSEYWSEVDERLRLAGATREQVQALWLKQATANPVGPFPEHARALAAALESIVHIAHDRFPNLQIAYLSSRAYGGYAESGRRNPARLNPEPYAYESAFAVRWLIERQIAGDAALNPDPAQGAVTAPALLWGPYLWADGTVVRSDGLVWNCSDFLPDGTTPSAGGAQKVAIMLMAFLKTHPTSVPWFMADPNATPNATATALPTITPAPTNTPGRRRPTRRFPTRGPTLTSTPGPSPTPRPTRTPAPLMSFRVREVPTNDEMWITTDNAMVQLRLRNIRRGRPLWVCGSVQVDADLEWGFRFDPTSVSVAQAPPQALRSTIRAISENPPSDPDARRCIRISGVTEQVPGTPPPAGSTPSPGSPSATVPPRAATPTGTPVRSGEGAEIYLPMLPNR